MRRWIGGIAALVLSGCAIGPNYHRPKVEVPAAYRGAESESPSPSSIADVPWWELFHDPVLEQLIEEALTNGYDIRIIAKRVEQARYAVGVTRADLLPQASYQGSAQRGKVFNPFGGDNVTGNNFFAALQMAWEIDVWGRIRRATEASLADLVAAEDVRRGVILSLVTGVSQAYFELRELDLEMEIALRTRDSFQQTLDLFTRQLVGGVGNKLATSRAAAALASTAATIPDLDRQIVAKENQIAILLGHAPGPVARGATLTDQTHPPDVPAGLPSSLLERRPDVLAAEQAIVASNAVVGVSIGNFLPRFGLTALYGAQSSEIENILKGPANLWSIGGSVLGPLFQGGRLYYEYRGSAAAWEVAKLAYEQAVLSALGEVSNALVAREKLALSRAELEREVLALQDSVRLATLRYTGGFASYYEVLEAQQQLFPAENTLARTELDQLVAFLQVYRALGGGWQSEEARHPDRYPVRRDALDAIVPGGGRPE
ncbi:MAG: efflux transporter outer membrane subunit [Deltaproteobacteria bacterium]|nr:MAG: efflux transporter outer membrane subunit [Deltaproteobacteria bacterium]